MTIKVLLLLALSATAWSFCPKCEQHPQQAACVNDLAIKAKVQAEPEFFGMATLMRIKINILQVMMTFPLTSGQVDLTGVDLDYAYISESIKDLLSNCGTNIKAGHKYLLAGSLSGNKLHLSVCYYNKLWSSLPRSVKKGFKLDYARKCEHCSVIKVLEPTPNTDNNCNWDFEDDPCRDISECTYNNQTSLCEWGNSRRYRRCLLASRK